MLPDAGKVHESEVNRGHLTLSNLRQDLFRCHPPTSFPRARMAHPPDDFVFPRLITVLSYSLGRAWRKGEPIGLAARPLAADEFPFEGGTDDLEIRIENQIVGIIGLTIREFDQGQIRTFADLEASRRGLRA